MDELLGKATLTPEEQSQLQTIVTYFKDNIDGFEDTWDRYVEISDGGKVNLKGDLGEIRTEINKTIDDYQKLANQSALSELQTENAKAKITANKNTAEIKTEMKSKYSEIQNTQKKLDDFLKKRNITQKTLENYYYGGGAKNDAFYKEGIELLEATYAYVVLSFDCEPFKIKREVTTSIHIIRNNQTLKIKNTGRATTAKITFIQKKGNETEGNIALKIDIDNNSSILYNITDEATFTIQANDNEFNMHTGHMIDSNFVEGLASCKIKIEYTEIKL